MQIVLSHGGYVRESVGPGHPYQGIYKMAQ